MRATVRPEPSGPWTGGGRGGESAAAALFGVLTAGSAAIAATNSQQRIALTLGAAGYAMSALSLLLGGPWPLKRGTDAAPTQRSQAKDLGNTVANNGSGQARTELERLSSRKAIQQPSLTGPDHPGQPWSCYVLARPGFESLRARHNFAGQSPLLQREKPYRLLPGAGPLIIPRSS
jgi:hypothetical protein